MTGYWPMNMSQILSPHARSRFMRYGCCERTVCQLKHYTAYTEQLFCPNCFIATKLGPASAVLPPKTESTCSSAAASEVATVRIMFHQSQNCSPTQTISLLKASVEQCKSYDVRNATSRSTLSINTI